MDRRRYLSLCALGTAGATAGCTGGSGSGDDGDDRLDNGLVLDRIRETLDEEGAEIHELTDREEVVVLEYAPGGLPEDADGDEIEARIEETIRDVSSTYYEPIVGPGSGWRADRLDASVFVDGDLVTTWYLKTEWADECTAIGDVRGCLEERVQDSVERKNGTNGTEGN